MKVLVYEAAISGHFLNHAAQVANALAEAGAETHLAVAVDAPGEFGFENYIARLRGRVEIHPIIRCAPVAHPYALGWQRLTMLRKAVDQVQPDRLYMSAGDGVVQLLGMAKLIGVKPISPAVHVEALLLNGAVAYPQLKTRTEHARRRAYHWLARIGCDTLHHLNPMVREWEAENGTAESKKVLTMPDPVERDEMLTREQARSDLGLPRDARIVGMVGRLDFRKGADVLIDAFMSAKTSPQDFLVLWGPCSSTLGSRLKMLQERKDLRGRVWVRDQEINDHDFMRAIAAVDLMALPYRLVTGSSSIVIRAAAAGRPVITTAGGWAERMISEFELGWTFDGPDPNLLANQLPELLEKSRLWRLSSRGERFVQYNSCDNFAAHWSAGYRRFSGNVGSEQLFTWDSLLAE